MAIYESSSRSSSPASPLTPLRRDNGIDINLPPRYSTLIGALPPPTLSNPIASNDDIAISQPPNYSSVFQSRSYSLGDTRLSPNSSSYHDIQRSQIQFPRSTHSHSTNGIQKHEYYIMNGGKVRPWATLKVHSRTLLSSDRQRTPHFMKDDIIRGDLELNFDTPQNINSISLSVSDRSQSSICLFTFIFSIVAGPHYH